MDVLLMLGGVAVFMYGMKLMSSGLEQSAGSKIRNLFKKLDRNRVVNYGIGIGSTAVVQSSSATSIMTVGLAHADIVTVKQGAGYILGAKVGTTLTAFLFALSGTREENVFGPEAQHMRAPLREAAKDRQIIMDRRAKSLPPPKKTPKTAQKLQCQRHPSRDPKLSPPSASSPAVFICNAPWTP